MKAGFLVMSAPSDSCEECRQTRRGFVLPRPSDSSSRGGLQPDVVIHLQDVYRKSGDNGLLRRYAPRNDGIGYSLSVIEYRK